MKSICLAAAFTVGATAAFAGSLAEPEADIYIPAPQVEDERGSLGASSSGALVPAALVALLLAAAASGGS